jgi:predicted RNA-binding protein (virulence factor B family)
MKLMKKNQETNAILDEAPEGVYTVGQSVQLIIKKKTDLGYKAIVDAKYWGVLYYDEVFQELDKDQEIEGYIKNFREDGRIDLTLYKTGIKGRNDLAQFILETIKETGGFLDITAKTEAEEIYKLFGVSKKKFKIALGNLYKKRLIEIKDDGIYLVPLYKYPKGI